MVRHWIIGQWQLHPRQIFVFIATHVSLMQRSSWNNGSKRFRTGATSATLTTTHCLGLNNGTIRRWARICSRQRRFSSDIHSQIGFKFHQRDHDSRLNWCKYSGHLKVSKKWTVYFKNGTSQFSFVSRCWNVCVSIDRNILMKMSTYIFRSKICIEKS